MKLFIKYLGERKRTFCLAAACCLVFVCSFLLYHLPLGAVIYPTLLCFGIGAVVCVLDFLRTKREHEAMGHIKTFADTMSDNFPSAKSIIEKDYQQVLRLLCEEYAMERCEKDREYADMVEYYTVWAHQIKTPIASMRLHLQNEDSQLSRKLSSELHRIEQYVEMVLAFLRLNSESTDYVFKAHELDEIVRAAVRKFSSDFINRKLSLDYEPLNTVVVTDEKWLSFVIEQVLSNALKYTHTGGITISLADRNTLRISDTGIGIAPEDIPRVFENGYTGYNGRADKKASGIGLYLCKRICTNLGHKITISSAVDVGTAVDIDLSRAELEIE